MQLIWTLVLVACSDKSTDSATPTGSTPTDSVPTGNTDDTDTTTTTTTTPPATATVSGTVTLLDGTPVSGARVNVCRVQCAYTDTDAAGNYVISPLSPWEAAFYVVPSASSGLLTPIVLLTLTDGETRDLDAVLLPADKSSALPATSTEVEVVEGVYLTVGADILEPAPLTELGDTISAVRVPDGASLPIELAGTVLGTWYFAPFEAESEHGVGVRLDNLWGLAPGTTVEVYAMSMPTEFSWLLAGTLTVDAGGTSLTGDAKLPILTTMVVVQP